MGGGSGPTPQGYPDPGSASGVPFPFGGGGGCTSCDKNNPPLGMHAYGKTRLESGMAPGPTDGRVYRQIAGPLAMTTGSFVRAVIAWDSCPATMTGTAPAPVARDYDLFLAKGTQLVDGSQSVNDVTEGFDVTIPSSLGAGNYYIWIAWPAGNMGCAGKGAEPFGFEYWTGTSHP